MKLKAISGIMLALLLTSMFAIVSSSQSVESEQKTEIVDSALLEDFKALSDSEDEWPMFHHDLNNTGYSTSTAPNTNSTAWEYVTGDDIHTSSPAVVDKKVYIASLDKKIYCLNALTGAHIWNYSTGDLTSSSPAVADGKVYVGSKDGKIYCLDASTGAFIWSYTTGDAVWSSPAVADGKVYVGSDDNKIYCLDALTGAYIWDYTTGGDIWASPAVADNKVYIGSWDNKIHCLNALTGAHIWNYTTISNIEFCSPAVADGKVYVGSWGMKIYCLDALSGAHIWNYTTVGAVQSSPAVAYGKVYFGSAYSPTVDDKVYCLDATTGAHIWDYTTYSSIVSSPAVADGKVYVGSSGIYMDSYGHRIHCLDATTGAHIWSYRTGGSVDSSPAVAYGNVYVGSKDNKVYAFGPNKYAILIAPLRDSDTDTLKNDMKYRIHKMRLVLLDNGWSDQNIIYLTRNDTARQAPSEPWVDGDATRENLGRAFGAITSGGKYQFRLQDGTLGPEQTFKASSINDFIFIYYSDHGGQRSDTHSDEADNEEGVLCTYEWNDRDWNKSYYWDDTEIANALNSITCQILVLVVDSCHSGEFRDDCQDTGRIITSACTADEVAWQDTYPFPDAFTDPDGDGNHNGRVSIEEAHHYAELKTRIITDTQHPQISDGIAGEVHLV